VTMPAVPWVAAYAARKGFKYQPDADERWIRAWEPYATLKTPHRYEHVLESTGELGSITIARFVVGTPVRGPNNAWVDGEAAGWIAITQDMRLNARAATTSDGTRVYGESLDLVTLPRRATGDPVFDRIYASFAQSDDELTRAITPSVRRLLLGWQTALHLEI